MTLFTLTVFGLFYWSLFTLTSWVAFIFFAVSVLFFLGLWTTGTWDIRSGRKKRMNALVIDDDPSSLVVLIKVLQERGINFVIISDGSEAVKLMCRHGFDLIILDNEMPKISGPQVLRQADKVIEAGAKTPLPIGRKLIPVVGFSGLLCPNWNVPDLGHFQIVHILSKNSPLSKLRRDLENVCAPFTQITV